RIEGVHYTDWGRNMDSNLWRARVCLVVAGALLTMFLLSSCALLIPHRSGGSSASMDQKNLILETSDNPTRIVIPFPRGTAPGGLRSHGGPFGSSTDAETTTSAPVAEVVSFYQEKLADQRPRITVKGQESQLKWRDQHSRLTLTLGPTQDGTGTQIKLHVRE
ncbi:MAG: hypothetical protein ACM3VW_10260, partial [Bacteroidota bacterium]